MRRHVWSVHHVSSKDIPNAKSPKVHEGVKTYIEAAPWAPKTVHEGNYSSKNINPDPEVHEKEIVYWENNEEDTEIISANHETSSNSDQVYEAEEENVHCENSEIFSVNHEYKQ